MTGAVELLAPAKRYLPLYWVFSALVAVFSWLCSVVISAVASPLARASVTALLALCVAVATLVSAWSCAVSLSVRAEPLA